MLEGLIIFFSMVGVVTTMAFAVLAVKHRSDLGWGRKKPHRGINSLMKELLAEDQKGGGKDA